MKRYSQTSVATNLKPVKLENVSIEQLRDNAGWHTPENLAVPDSIRLIYQPAYSRELQLAEHLWPLVDEVLANKHFDTIDHLDVVVGTRCNLVIARHGVWLMVSSFVKNCHGCQLQLSTFYAILKHAPRLWVHSL